MTLTQKLAQSTQATDRNFFWRQTDEWEIVVNEVTELGLIHWPYAAYLDFI